MKTLIIAIAWMAMVWPFSSWAWGRRGHQVVAETAAYLAAEAANADFLKNHSFDLAYYSNVPDFIWKRPATYSMERGEHFMDLEIFEREFKAKPEIKDPLALSRTEFEQKFPQLKPEAGRAFWRIREMYDKLSGVSEKLRALKPDARKERQALQEQWLVLAGTMAHYVGDLGMPLHVSENYDGQLTGQKGIHKYFEDDLVDELYPELTVKVKSAARAQWKAFQVKHKEASVLDLIQHLASSSEKSVKPLLALDKGRARAANLNNARRFEKMIVERLAAASLVLGELYRRQTGWSFDDDKFYFFAGEPEYIKPGSTGEKK